jgi:hypothetical protein
VRALRVPLIPVKVAGSEVQQAVLVHGPLENPVDDTTVHTR